MTLSIRMLQFIVIGLVCFSLTTLLGIDIQTKHPEPEASQITHDDIGPEIERSVFTSEETRR